VLLLRGFSLPLFRLACTDAQRSATFFPPRHTLHGDSGRQVSLCRTKVGQRRAWNVPLSLQSPTCGLPSKGLQNLYASVRFRPAPPHFPRNSSLGRGPSAAWRHRDFGRLPVGYASLTRASASRSLLSLGRLSQHSWGTSAEFHSISATAHGRFVSAASRPRENRRRKDRRWRRGNRCTVLSWFYITLS
jgi:hypothetical protein